MYRADMQKISGVYNLTNGGETTWYGFTVAIGEKLMTEGLEKLAKVIPVGISDYHTPAARPKNSILSGGKLWNSVGLLTENYKTSLYRV